MNDLDLAQSLFRKSSEIVTEAFGGRLPPYTVEAEAMEDSADGMVAVQFMGDTVNLTDGNPDGDGAVSDELAEDGTAAQWVSVPCSATVKAGERVLVTIQDGAPIDATSIGWGDTMAATVSTASTLAEQAYQIASAVGQFAWNDTNGTHVSTEEGVSEGTRNILLNSYGILLRAAANYLAALTQSGIAFYDGTGNLAENVVASFGANGAQVGSEATTHLTVDADSVDIVDPDEGVLMSMGYDPDIDNAYIHAQRQFEVTYKADGGVQEGGGESGLSLFHATSNDVVLETRAALAAYWADDTTHQVKSAGVVSCGSLSDNNGQTPNGFIQIVAQNESGGTLTTFRPDYIITNALTRIANVLQVQQNIVLGTNNDAKLMGVDTTAAGSGQIPLVHINSSGNIILGNNTNSGITRIYGNNVDIVTGSKFRMGTSAPLLVKSYTKVVAAVTHGQNTADLTFDVTTSGYTPIAISGWRWDSGTRQNFFLNWSQYLDGNTAHMRFTNFHSTDSANGTLRIYVLFVRTEMV